MTNGLPIAESTEQLTAGWITEVLRRCDLLDASTAVIDVAFRPIGTGQMCDSLRVTLRYDRPTDAPATVIAKIPSADEATRATARAHRSYEIEVRFYQQLASELPMRTPQAFHADIDLDSYAFVLLLEDLAPAQQGDQLAGCTPDTAKVAVDELVKLHAPRWNDPSLASLEWLVRDRQVGQQSLVAFLPLLWDSFRDRYAADLGPDVHEAGAALFGDLEGYVFADTQPWTIVHGDYRLDNLLFDTSPGGLGVAVVDWQTCTVGSALQDVGYFIGAGLLPEVRREVETDLVRGYHRALQRSGVDYSWDVCWHAYRRGTWPGFIMAIAASMLVERTDRGDQMFLTMASRHARHVLDLNAADVLRG